MTTVWFCYFSPFSPVDVPIFARFFASLLLRPCLADAFSWPSLGMHRRCLREHTSPRDQEPPILVTKCTYFAPILCYRRFVLFGLILIWPSSFAASHAASSASTSASPFSTYMTCINVQLFRHACRSSHCSSFTDVTSFRARCRGTLFSVVVLCFGHALGLIFPIHPLGLLSSTHAFWPQKVSLLRCAQLTLSIGGDVPWICVVGVVSKGLVIVGLTSSVPACFTDCWVKSYRGAAFETFRRTRRQHAS
ncbi:unnamed protein product [Protopolystoma xenopodis]|uniref:Uncharacterized protein n=1 Tax=Protopolystoma xenopodis TaxID=117903 RepID=A0A3S5B0M9_9PLAT|nr:unnamed protein product [Protopolystoma xenopodis]